MNEEDKLTIIEGIIKDPSISPEDVVSKIQELYGKLDNNLIRYISSEINKKILNGGVE